MTVTLTVRLLCATLLCGVTGPVADAAARAAQAAAGLRIIVIEGEDAVNVIQQKTAVAPVVEVRDRNDQPVTGAVVNFAIRGGRATFGGARTLTVATNAAGRAAAAGLTPTASGTLQISASAAFQGQTAAVAIAQTNVMTAAEAAAASAGGAGGGGGAAAGAGGAAGGGGGLSATTLAIVGGAAAGGALVAKEAIGGGGTKYTGTYQGPLVLTFPGGGTCARTHQVSGTLEIELENPGGNTVHGTAKVTHQQTAVSSTCTGDPFVNRTEHFDDTAPLTGTTTAMVFSMQESNSVPPPDPPGAIHTATMTFAGALAGAEITGTLTWTESTTAPQGPSYAIGTATYPLTLR